MAGKSAIVLSIAASDSSAGAGAQADIKTCMAVGAFAVTVITAITAQNTQGVQHIYPLPPVVVGQQLKSLLDDVEIDIVKISVIPDRQTAEVIAEYIRKMHCEVIWDPVLKSSSGKTFIDQATLAVIKTQLMPYMDLLTPNLPESSVLLGSNTETQYDLICQGIQALGPKRVLLKGGHASGKQHCEDYFYESQQGYRLQGLPVVTPNTHGTGCTLSAAIAAYRAQGFSWLDAVKQGKSYCQEAINQGVSLQVGTGCGPLQHRVTL